MSSGESVVAFRDATLSDVPAVMKLVHSAYRGDESRKGWTTEADLLDGNRIDAGSVRDVITAPESLIMLAFRRCGPEPAGSHHDGAAASAASALWACCQLAVEGDGLGYFGLFAVRPDRQGAGIGKAVLAEAERRAVTEWQCTALRMLVIRQRADLIAWYERLGFARTGATSPFPYRDERFGRPRRQDLEFIELRKQLA